MPTLTMQLLPALACAGLITGCAITPSPHAAQVRDAMPETVERCRYLADVSGASSVRQEENIMMKTIRNLLAVTLFAFSALAIADGYTIQTPGQMPSYVTPSYGGGYTIQTPGQMPTYVTPSYGGGATIQTPGQMPSYVTPSYGGGSTIQTPGQMPTYVTPSYGGDYTIQTPGQMPSYANPNYGGGYTVQTPGQMPTYINPQ